MSSLFLTRLSPMYLLCQNYLKMMFLHETSNIRSYLKIQHILSVFPLYLFIFDKSSYTIYVEIKFWNTNCHYEKHILERCLFHLYMPHSSLIISFNFYSFLSYPNIIQSNLTNYLFAISKLKKTHQIEIIFYFILFFSFYQIY